MPEDLAAHLREIKDSLEATEADNEVRMIHYRIRRPDGSLRHLEVRYRNVYDGGRGRAFGLVFDVTATRALESKFQEAMEHTRMAWFERDLVSDEMRGSRSLWQIYGFDPNRQPLHFSEILTHIHPEDAEQHPADTRQLQARSRALRGKVEETATEVVFYRVIPPGGDEHWLEVRYRLHLDGMGGGTVSGLVVDVTTTKLAEAAARDTDMRLRIALEAAQMASWTWDLDKDVIHSTDAFGDMLDLETPSPWPVPDVLHAIHPDDVAKVRAEIERVRACAKTQDLRMEYRVRTAHGEERWMEKRADGATVTACTASPSM